MTICVKAGDNTPAFAYLLCSGRCRTGFQVHQEEEIRGAGPEDRDAHK